LIGEIVKPLAFAVAASEQAQRRFRAVVISRLARIETIVQMIHGAQIAETHISEPRADEKIDEHTRDAEGYIATHSEELGIKLVKFIYDEAQSPAGPHKSRRKWSDWEI